MISLLLSRHSGSNAHFSNRSVAPITTVTSWFTQESCFSSADCKRIGSLGIGWSVRLAGRWPISHVSCCVRLKNAGHKGRVCVTTDQSNVLAVLRLTVELDSVSKPGCRAVVGTYMCQVEFHTHRRRCGEVECAWRGLKRIKCASPQHFLFIKYKGVAKIRSEKKLNTSEQVNRKRSKVKSWKRGVNSNTTKTIWDFIRHLHQERNARGRGQDTLLTS